MPTSNDAVNFLNGASAPAKLRWINKNRRSADWKVKIFQHDPSGLQIAIYDRAGVFALIETSVEGVPGVKQLPKRPMSDALKTAGSKFASHPGFYYEVDDLTSLGALISKYLSQAEAPVADAASLFADFDDQVANSLADSAENRRHRLKSAPVKPRKVKVTTSVFVRNADVVAEVLHRANGSCEGCKKEAPFTRRSTGGPYLEVHHRTPLAQGGDDTVLNAVALCPNCHRRQHYG